MAQSNVPWRIIAGPDMSSRPIKPAIKTSLIYGIILSIFLSSIIILIRDRLDYVFFNTKEVLNDLKIPSLANILI